MFSVNDLLNWSLGVLSQFGVFGLIALSFMEASFFPIPPDVLLIPMCLTTPDACLLYGFITTISSAVGGLFGYLIGLKGGRLLLLRIVNEERLATAERYFNKYGLWAVGISAVTPLPYKVFTIAAGVFKLKNIVGFFLVSFIGRACRFLPESLLLMIYGENVMSFIMESFQNFILVIVLVVVILYITYLLIRRQIRKI